MYIYNEEKRVSLEMDTGETRSMICQQESKGYWLLNLSVKRCNNRAKHFSPLENLCCDVLLSNILKWISATNKNVFLHKAPHANLLNRECCFYSIYYCIEWCHLDIS